MMSNNQYQQVQQPAISRKSIDFYNTALNELNLDVDAYSLEDLYNLFNISSHSLNAENLKEAKKIVLKMHPDKSRLDSKYFLFFSAAFKRLVGIYEFQNKQDKQMQNQGVQNMKYDASVNIDNAAENNRVLQQMFETRKDLKKTENFNGWFNEQFEKFRIDDPIANGYGDWLKSDDGLAPMPTEKITKSNMNEVFEKQKKQVQSLVVYQGVAEAYAPLVCGTLLNENQENFGFGELFSGGALNYTDLKQAHMESVIPVSDQDFNNMPQFKNVEEYKRHRDSVNTTPLSEAESQRILQQKSAAAEQESAALAYRYAVEAEKARKQSQSFWGQLKQIALG